MQSNMDHNKIWFKLLSERHAFATLENTTRGKKLTTLTANRLHAACTSPFISLSLQQYRFAAIIIATYGVRRATHALGGEKCAEGANCFVLRTRSSHSWDEKTERFDQTNNTQLHLLNKHYSTCMNTFLSELWTRLRWKCVKDFGTYYLLDIIC